MALSALVDHNHNTRRAHRLHALLHPPQSLLIYCHRRKLNTLVRAQPRKREVHVILEHTFRSRQTSRSPHIPQQEQPQPTSEFAPTPRDTCIIRIRVRLYLATRLHRVLIVDQRSLPCFALSSQARQSPAATPTRRLRGTCPRSFCSSQTA